MSGKNVSLLNIPPGVNRTASQYAVGMSWWNANRVRWFSKMLIPIGGWVKQYQFSNLAEKALLTYANGISFSFLDGSLCIKTGGVTTYSGSIPADSIVGTIIYGKDGSYLDSSNYIKFLLAGLAENYSSHSTILTEWSLPSLTGTQGQVVSWLGNSGTTSNNHRQEAYSSSPITSRAIVQSPAANEMVRSGAPWVAPTVNTVYRLASAYQVNDGNAAWNNLLQTTDTAINVPTGFDTLYLGRSGITATSGLRGYLKTAVILPERLANAALQTWSALASTAYSEPIRDTHSWRDLLKNPWAAYGSANALWGASVNPDNSYTFYNITPSGLGYNPGGLSGYGSGLYGMGVYGISPEGGIGLDSNGQWSLDNFGKMLAAVSSQDGRLCIWDPATPSTPAIPVAAAPVDNTLVIATDEEFLMLLGGKNNPRRVKWASQRTYTDWTPTALNSAGGFDLQSNGSIIGACRVPGGILVHTDTDVHLLEYVGAPYYYGRRRVSEESSLLSKNALVPIIGGAIWMGTGNFWSYNGTVSPVLSTVDYDVFYKTNLDKANLVHAGINSFAQEVWFFYPSLDSSVPDKYVAFSHREDPYWTLGDMTRTAWLNPCWQSKPIGINDQILYQQETGNTADGLPRGAFAETGGMELSDGDKSTRIDRIYSDITSATGTEDVTDSLQMTFKLKQAPDAPERVYGPLNMSSPKGYVNLRMRARQIALRVDETKAVKWVLGKQRIRAKEGGSR